MFVQFQWEINVFLLLLSCFSVFPDTPPDFIPEAVVQNHNYHINHNTNVQAADLKPPGSLYACCLCLCFNICLSMPCLFLAHLFILIHLVLEMIQNEKTPQLQEIFCFCIRVDLQTNLKTKNKREIWQKKSTSRKTVMQFMACI